MNYREATEFLFSQLPMYQRSGKAAYKANLDNTQSLDRYDGHPHRRFRSIHVAGTNGKGSVSHMLASVFQEAGYRTGLYTSPHLLDFRERIRINGIPIPEESVTGYVETHQQIIRDIRPSFFEMTVAMAFDYFAGKKVDIAIVETGMGGRLDSTNILEPVLSVITNITMDHTEFLGSTIELISAEKGGIIKPSTPLVLGPMLPEAKRVLLSMAKEKNAPAELAGERYEYIFHTFESEGKARFTFRDLARERNSTWVSGLVAGYQQENLRTVLTVLDVLAGDAGRDRPVPDIQDEAIRKGLQKVVENTGILGRWQTIGANPRSICDTAHNQAGVQLVMAQISQIPRKKLHVIWGMVSDKDTDGILSLLPADASYYFTRASIPRALDEQVLKEKAAGHGLHGRSFPDVPTAYSTALREAGMNDMIFTGGSTFVVADILGHLRG